MGVIIEEIHIPIHVTFGGYMGVSTLFKDFISYIEQYYSKK